MRVRACVLSIKKNKTHTVVSQLSWCPWQLWKRRHSLPIFLASTFILSNTLLCAVYYSACIFLLYPVPITVSSRMFSLYLIEWDKVMIEIQWRKLWKFFCRFLLLTNFSFIIHSGMKVSFNEQPDCESVFQPISPVLMEMETLIEDQLFLEIYTNSYQP